MEKRLRSSVSSSIAMGEVKLIGSRSTQFCTRIEWALKLKGVEYEYIHEDATNKSPLLLKLNPIIKKIPVLIHGDKVLAESLVILEYIDNTWKENPLLPRDPYGKSTARFWAKFNDDKCIFGAWDACHLEGEEKQKAMDAEKENLAFLEKQIEGKKFFGGENIGFLDLVVGWIPFWLGALEEVGDMKLLDEVSFPSLYEWSENFMKAPNIKECLIPREELLNHFQATVSYVRSLAASKK